jgi:Uma2 family endonuclease
MSQAVIDTPEELTVDVAEIVTEDDTPVDNLFSEKQQRLLTESLYNSWGGPEGEGGQRRKFLVAANVGLFPSVHQPPLVPDVFLSLDVEVAEEWYEKRHRTYFFWEFGKPPEVVIEIVSNRRGNELGSKLQDYARIAVSYYVVYDPGQMLGEEELRVYELYGGRYQRREDGSLPGVGLGVVLWEGVYEGKRARWLRWCDEKGELIATGAENTAREAERAARAEERATLEAERAARAEERATLEAERAARAEERAARLAARMRELGVDPDQP